MEKQKYYKISEADIINIADAIREKNGTSEKMEVKDMPKEIREAPGGPSTYDATATADDILIDKTAYSKGKKIVGTIKTYDYSNSELTPPQDPSDDPVVPSMVCEYWLGTAEQYELDWSSGKIASTTICFITSESGDEPIVEPIVQDGSILYIYEGVTVAQNNTELVFDSDTEEDVVQVGSILVINNCVVVQTDDQLTIGG